MYLPLMGKKGPFTRTQQSQEGGDFEQLQLFSLNIITSVASLIIESSS